MEMKFRGICLSDERTRVGENRINERYAVDQMVFKSHVVPAGEREETLVFETFSTDKYPIHRELGIEVGKVYDVYFNIRCNQSSQGSWFTKLSPYKAVPVEDESGVISASNPFPKADQPTQQVAPARVEAPVVTEEKAPEPATEQPTQQQSLFDDPQGDLPF